MKFFSLDAYYDIKLCPLFHNQWAVPQYIVIAGKTTIEEGKDETT